MFSLMAGTANLGNNETAIYNWLKTYSSFDTTTFKGATVAGLDSSFGTTLQNGVEMVIGTGTQAAQLMQNAITQNQYEAGQIIQFTMIMNGGNDIVIHSCASK